MDVFKSAIIFLVISNLVTPALCDTSTSSVDPTTSPLSDQATTTASPDQATTTALPDQATTTPLHTTPSKDDTMGIIVISVLCFIALLGLIGILAWNKCRKKPADTPLPIPAEDQLGMKIEETQLSEVNIKMPPLPLQIPGPVKPAEPKSQMFTQKTQALSKYSDSLEDSTQSQDERTTSTQHSSVKNTQYTVANPSSSA